MVPLEPAALAEEEQEEDVMIAALPTTEGRVSRGDATSTEAEGDDDNDEFLPSRRGTWDLLDAAASATPAVTTPAPAPTTLADALATVTAGETPESASGNSFCPPPLAAAALEFLDEGNGISMEAEPSPAAAAAAAVAAAVVEVVVAVSGGD